MSNHDKHDSSVPDDESDATTRAPHVPQHDEKGHDSQCECGVENSPEGEGVDVTRRNALKGAGGAALALATPLSGVPFVSQGKELVDSLKDQHWEEMSEKEREELCRKLEEEYRHEYDRDDIEVAPTDAPNEVVFGYALDIQKCIGCRRCVYACAEENNNSRAGKEPSDNQLHWIRVLEFEDHHLEPGKEKSIGTEFGSIEAGLSLERSDHYYESEEVPEDDMFYLPVQCQHCEDPPCVKVCPVNATWKDDDGIVVVDYDWCIGCRYCMTACPYYARRFNFGETNLSSDEINPDTHYLGNRPRPPEVVDKCTFCIQRSRDGEYTACVEACPVGARKFGNLLDPESEIRKILEEKRVFRLKEELGTEPKFFYFME